MLTALAAMPVSVVPQTPSAGIRKNPAAIAPSAAPVVLAAYTLPPADAAAPLAEYHRTAIGKVAPSATAGTNTTARHTTSRLSGKNRPAPSAYVHFSSGTSAESSKGIANAVRMTSSSSPA